MWSGTVPPPEGNPGDLGLTKVRFIRVAVSPAYMPPKVPGETPVLTHLALGVLLNQWLLE